MIIETAQCPRCPSWMIRWPTGMVPARASRFISMEWWCGCGYRAPAGTQRATNVDEASAWWHAVNRQRRWEARQAAPRRLPWWRRLLGA